MNHSRKFATKQRSSSPKGASSPGIAGGWSSDRALSVILTTMLVVLGAGVLLGEIFAPQYVWLAFKGFRTDPESAALCVSLTRLILPAQLFFFIGSVIALTNVVPIIIKSLLFK